MAKDPAVLFYTSDFLTGTMLMSDEEIGQYIKLLCLQHQRGRLTENHMLTICKAKENEVFNKFTKDENGLYYNERMEFEAIKRKNFTESRKHNGSKGGRPKKEKPNAKPSGKPKHNLTENENENINIIINYLNNKSGKNFKYDSDSTISKLIARFKEGFTIDQFKKVIDIKTTEWLNTDFEKFLRPETLFGNKFEGYLNQQSINPKSKMVY